MPTATELLPPFITHPGYMHEGHILIETASWRDSFPWEVKYWHSSGGDHISEAGYGETIEEAARECLQNLIEHTDFLKSPYPPRAKYTPGVVYANKWWKKNHPDEP